MNPRSIACALLILLTIAAVIGLVGFVKIIVKMFDNQN